MLFNSYEFIFLFLPITFVIYFYLNKKRLTEASNGFLVVSSLFFYSWWNIVYLPLILISMVFNYGLGTALTKNESPKGVSKRKLLTFGVIGNLGLLGYFKYSDFFISNLNFIAGTGIPTLNLALPLAISFFTFQQIAYLVDSFKGETKEYDFLNYAIFVTFFPQLIAGPIVHHKEMMPQFARLRNKLVSYAHIAPGLFIFSIGLFKKVVIADTFAVWASRGFAHAGLLNFGEAWIASLSYTFQLYFDFSGYTDMAVGAALLFNIYLPINFNSPYKALDIQDFWRRWHITLSRFLRDYIYIPLGGNRSSNFRTCNNLLATFVIGGLWHGAGWTFIFWGVLHGVALIIHRLWKQMGLRMPSLVAWFITFNFVNIGWIFFKAERWNDAIQMLKAMVGLNGIVLPSMLATKFSHLGVYGVQFGEFVTTIGGTFITPFWVLGALIAVLVLKNSVELRRTFSPNIGYIAITWGALFIAISSLNTVSEFLYFNF